MNLKVTKNIQQLVAQRRAKKIETVRNEVITVNLKEARAKLAEATGTKQTDSPTTPPPVDPQEVLEVYLGQKYPTPPPVAPQDVAPVTDTIFAEATGTKQIVEKPEDTPQAPEHATASLSPLGDDPTAPAPVDADVSSWEWVNPACSDCDPVAADASSGTGLESVDASTFFKAFVDTADVAVKKPTRSRSRSKSKSKK